EEFLARYRRGERPALTEYTQRYPALAEQIRELFPALVAMEAIGSVDSQATGPEISLGTDQSPLPRQLGDYRILREVGRGGMGVVYEAVREALGGHVALKVLPLHGLASPTHLERFRREAKAAARLHHTNIVPVFGVGEHAGIHYYAMEFIQGQGLDLVLKELKGLRRSTDPWGLAEAPPPDEARPDRSDRSVCIAKSLVAGRFEDVQVAPLTQNPSPQAGEGSRDVSPLPPSGREAGGEGAAAGSHPELTSQPEAQYFLSVARVGVQV